MIELARRTTAAVELGPGFEAVAGDYLVRVPAGEAAAPDGAFDVGVMMDMTMLSLVAGRARRLSEYAALLTAAGWPTEQVQATRSSYSLIEAVPA